jgi:hypothetical protein
MKHLSRLVGTLILPLALMLGLGCKKQASPPTPLPIEQLPSALQNAFNKAKPEAKDLANQVLAALQTPDYGKAFNGLQNLLGKPGLTKEQVNVTTRGSLTVNTLLQSAQASGDAKAAQTLKAYRINK